MSKFETNVCPLCNKVLRFRRVAGVNVFDCATQIEWNGSNGVMTKSHYEVEFDKATTIQHMYVGSWGIDNFADKFRSRIYKKVMVSQSETWKFVAEVPQLRADTEYNLHNRINGLTLTP